MLKYPAIIHREENCYWLEFPDLETCVTQGDTMEELVNNGQDALSLHLSVMFDENEDIPEPSNLHGEDVQYIAPYYDISIPILLKKLRNENKITQSELAEKMHIKPQTYQKLEWVKKSNPSIKTLEKVAKALGKELIVDIV